MRSGVTEKGVTELIAVVEHVHALCRITIGLGLDGEPEDSFVTRKLLSEPVPSKSEEVLQVATQSSFTRGTRLYWQVLARNPHYLKATWEKHQTVLEEGELSAVDKTIVAFAVALQSGSPSWRDQFAEALDQDGVSPSELLEIIGVVDHYNSFNKITDGMQVESDIVPPQ